MVSKGAGGAPLDATTWPARPRLWRPPIRTSRPSSPAGACPRCGTGRAGFPTLVHIILEQQVSLASAKAAYDRLLVAADPLTPSAFLALSDAELLAIGFSRQKTRYGRGLAAAIVDGSLDLDGLGGLPDADVERALIAVPGIGPWTATIYLLMVLGRPDVWPVGTSRWPRPSPRSRAWTVDPMPTRWPGSARPGDRGVRWPLASSGTTTWVAAAGADRRRPPRRISAALVAARSVARVADDEHQADDHRAGDRQ